MVISKANLYLKSDFKYKFRHIYGLLPLIRMLNPCRPSAARVARSGGAAS